MNLSVFARQAQFGCAPNTLSMWIFTLVFVSCALFNEERIVYNRMTNPDRQLPTAPSATTTPSFSASPQPFPVPGAAGATPLAGGWPFPGALPTGTPPYPAAPTPTGGPAGAPPLSAALPPLPPFPAGGPTGALPGAAGPMGFGGAFPGAAGFPGAAPAPVGAPGSLGGGQLGFEESYIENILRLNLGKIATVYMTYENNAEWNAKIFVGRLEAAGRDHIILSDPKTGMRFLLLMVNLDYITFTEELNYEYPGFTPGSAGGGR